MHSINVRNGIIIAAFVIFAAWFFGKSLGYDARTSSLWVARNQVGDFGLHLALVRSFSWGENYPPQSPFYPGQPLLYHYGFDLLAGLTARTGIRVDSAINFFSIIALTALLLLILRLARLLFGPKISLGLLSVMIFLSPGGWSYLDFFRLNKPSQWMSGWWRLPNFVHSGPFDGSIYSTYFSLNVYLNQRHLVAALALGLGLIIHLYEKCVKEKTFRWQELILFGAVLGAMFWIHSLVFVGSVLIIGLLLVFHRRWRDVVAIFTATLLVSLPHAWVILKYATPHVWWYPGFLALHPLTIFSWLSYWWQNEGVILLLLPIGAILASPKQRTIFWLTLPMFAAANLFQFSYRVEHNHSLFNYFFLLNAPYSAFALYRIWRQGNPGKIGAAVLTLVIALNAVIQFPAIKNDFHYPVPDAPGNPLIAWIKKSTPPRSIFLAPPDLMDPVTLSGRFNYVGASYYLDVMGVNPERRRQMTYTYLSHPGAPSFRVLRTLGVAYILISKKTQTSYPAKFDNLEFSANLATVYRDQNQVVYRL